VKKQRLTITAAPTTNDTNTSAIVALVSIVKTTTVKHILCVACVRVLDDYSIINSTDSLEFFQLVVFSVGK